MKYNKVGESVDNYLRKRLKEPKFRKLYEAESRKVKLGFLIHQLRTHAGLTQMELAQRVGVTKGYIARVETAENANYEINTLKKIAAALHKVLVIGFVKEPKDLRTLERKALVAC